MSYSVSIAHLSDLHFGDRSRFKEKNPAELGRECVQAIKGSMKIKFGKERPDLVLVTGDITQGALTAEFDHAKKFFISLQTSLEIPRSSFTFLPGNHDVSREECEEYFKTNPDKRSLPYDQDLELIKFRQFNNFPSNFYEEDKPKVLELPRGAVLYQYDKTRICLIALNSCEMVTDLIDKGFVSTDQIKKAMDNLGEANYKDYIKILALHHPINPLPERALKWLHYLKTLNAEGTLNEKMFNKFESDALPVEGHEGIKEIAKQRQVHLILHGHLHGFGENQTIRWNQSEEYHEAEYCQIGMAGSFGLAPEKLPEQQSNGLKLIRLFTQNARLHFNSFFLEYDLSVTPDGAFTPGCFRDTSRTPMTASFPIPNSLRYWSGSSEEEETAEGKTDRVFLEYLQTRIKTVLQETPVLCTLLSQKIKGIDDPGNLAQTLIEWGFVRVWRDVVGELTRFKIHLNELKRILFLLAQGAVKTKEISKIRKQMPIPLMSTTDSGACRPPDPGMPSN